MLRLRPYNKSDAEIIMSWIKDERAFYKWTAGVLGEYPISEEQFNTVKAGDELYEEFQRIYDESVDRGAGKDKAEDKMWNRGRGR